MKKVEVVVTGKDELSWVLRKLNTTLTNFGTQAKGAWKGVEASLDRVKTSALWLWSALSTMRVVWVWAIWAIGLWIISTAGKFEKFESILTNTLQSTQKAAAAMKMLKDVSKETPFELDRLTASYVKLANRWFEPTRQQIVQLWDVAASLGKDFDMLVEALLDAQTGEMERLKEFGITAQQNWNKVAFTFKGVTTTVEKTDQAIRDYILSLGTLDGVQGSMIVQSQTFEGKVSNLKDSWTNLSDTLGSVFLPAAKESVSAMTDLINNVDDNVKAIIAWKDSANSNVLLVANSFDILKQWASWLLDVWWYFSSAMEAVKSSAWIAYPAVSAMVYVTEKLLWLAWKSISYFKSRVGADVGAAANLLIGAGTTAADEMLARVQTKTPPPKPRIPTGSWGGSNAEKTKEIQQEKELLSITKQRIDQVNSLAISEDRKAQLILNINQEMQKELKAIRGDDLEDTKNYFDEIAKTAEVKLWKTKDKFKWIYDAVKEAINKSKGEIESFTDKINDSLDKIKDLNKSLWEVGKDKQTALTDRFVEITKELSSMQAQTFGSIAERDAFEARQAALRRELELITSNVGQEWLSRAVAFEQLSPAEKILQKAEEKRAEIELEIKAEGEKVALLEKQRSEEITRMDNFNTAKNKIEMKYTQMFKDQLEERTVAYSKFISDINALSNASKVKVWSIVNTEISGTRAGGWPVSAWSAYIVGERWPELFTSNTSGQIIPNGGGQVVVNFNGSVSMRSDEDIKKLAKAISDEQARQNQIYKLWAR